MNATGRCEGIGWTGTYEWDATDNIFSVGICNGIAWQLVSGRNDAWSRNIVAHGGMTAIRHVVCVGCIEHVSVQTFIHRPVKHKSWLASVEYPVTIACLLLVCENMIPYTNLGKVTLEGIILCNAFCTAYWECRMLFYYREVMSCCGCSHLLWWTCLQQIITIFQWRIEWAVKRDWHTIIHPAIRLYADSLLGKMNITLIILIINVACRNIIHSKGQCTIAVFYCQQGIYVCWQCNVSCVCSCWGVCFVWVCYRLLQFLYCTEEVHPVIADINRVYQCKSLVLPLCGAHASFLIAVYYHTVAQFLIAWAGCDSS